MAQVPNILPDVRPEGRVPDDYIHTQANPNEFGAQIAQGTERLGQGVTTAVQHFGEIQTDDVVNNTLKQGNDLVGKLTSLKGNAALEQGPGIKQQLDELYKSGRE